jgi:hypothetical protein
MPHRYTNNLRKIFPLERPKEEDNELDKGKESGEGKKDEQSSNGDGSKLEH